MGLDELARKIKTRPARWLWVGSALLESNGCLLRLAYPRTHTVQPQQQKRQQVKFVLGVVVMANLVFLQLVPAPHPVELA